MGSALHPVSWFRDLGVRTKVLTALGLAAGVAVFVGAYGLVALHETSGQTQRIADEGVAMVALAGDLERSTTELRLAVTNQAVGTDAASAERFERAASTWEARVRSVLVEYRASGPTAEQLALLDAFESQLETYLVLRDQHLYPAGRANDLESWAAARDVGGSTVGTMTLVLDELMASERAEIAATADAAEHAYVQDRTAVIAILTIGLVAALWLGSLVVGALVRRLRSVESVAGALQRGDLTVSTGLTGRDEVGRMAASLDDAIGSLRTLVGRIEGAAVLTAGAAEEMSGTTSQIAAGAEETSVRAGVVSAAAEQVSRNVQTVASGAEEMGASIREIARTAGEASRIADDAVDAAQSTTSTVSRLGESSREIGNVVKVITSIADQTNLLALNATIEAARAGEAGRGFAVVAGEVKELAQETARATGDIARRVEAIQSDTTGAVESIGRISQIIDAIHAFQATIASAVEEQTATTSEMTRNVAEAATGSQEIAQTIAGVAGSAVQTTAGVEQSTRAVGELARMSADLRELVGRFTV
ncbi:methyl-accepting chemotaxis protein [Actinotalea sp.]|uniref:methyl-accepting chemotaxis protein n=1 Tax=Actinotalea sp. TaxID=1872145 RepID=UPI0035683671